MSSPLGLDIKINTEEMSKGDCIPCRYTALTSGQPGYFSELGTSTAPEIPVTGTPTPDGTFYFNMVEPTLLIADRVVQTNISWNALNNARLIEGASNLIKTSFSPIMTSNNTPAPYIVSANSIYNDNDADYGAWNATTFSTSTFWLSKNQRPEGGNWLKIDLNTPKVFNSIRLSSIPNYNTAISLKNWVLYGSNNDIDYIQITTGFHTASANVLQTYNFNNNNAYRYYRINCLDSYETNETYGLGNVIVTIELSYNNILIRSLSGGCAYVDENENMSLTDKNLGAWPVNNEWDKYIVNSDLGGKITPGDDNVWHWNLWNWGKETPINGLITDTSSNNINTYRVTRGYAPDGILELDTGLTTFTSANGGFRPVLQLKHPKQTNLWY